MSGTSSQGRSVLLPSPTIRLLLALAVVGGLFVAFLPSRQSQTATTPRVTVNGDRFVLSTGEPFTPWGFNYLGLHGELAEESWHTPEGWARIETDFRAMKNLGANVVRWHMQFETYMAAPDQPKPDQLARLRKLLDLARDTGLYLDLTGLNCFRRDRIPAWYDALLEPERWAAQEAFWEAVAKTCAGHPAVFCYDLTNEPIIGAPKAGEHPWVTGELGGFCFLQRISHNPAGRDQKGVAAAWVRAMVQAIRRHDDATPVTVGVIPWAFVWPTAKPVFYSPRALQYLDIVSVHVYPKPNNLEKELTALAVYDLGKPLVIEEIFPMACSVADLDEFIDATDGMVDGWVSHYFGRTPAEHRAGKELAEHLKAAGIEHWQRKGADMRSRLNSH